jgi:hypothetical protein
MFLELAAFISLAAAAAVPSPHPHDPKAVKLQGAGGMVTVLYFTVQFNATHLTELKPGFDWHLGFAELNAAVDLRCGDARIAKGVYKLNARRGSSAGDWNAVLVPSRLWSARRAVARAQRVGGDAETEAKAALEMVESELRESGAPAETVLPLSEFQDTNAEHLAVVGLHYGYATTERGSDQPASGMECGIRVSFGDLHRELKLTEVFAADGK